jgi:hypothetical protein
VPPPAGPDTGPGSSRQPGAPGLRRLSRRGRIGVGVLVLAIVAVLGVRSGLAGLRSIRAAAYPSAWDPRVVGLAAFVEQERGLDFLHPVAVDFLTVAEYRTQATGDTGTDDMGAAELDQQASLFRALGLASGPLDFGRAADDFAADGTLAYYDDRTERITVRGTGMTVGTRVTLVHELTHALQDQHFDLGRDLGSDGADSAFQALVEGDATRIEDAYVWRLSEDDSDAYWDEADRQSEEADADLTEVPAALQTLVGASYALGEPYASLLVSSGGQEALDRAFRRPPTSELALLDPAAGLAGDKPRTVPQPRLGPGEKKTDATDLGALTLYTMLASRIDQAQALAAVDGWDGDALVTFDRKDGRATVSCARFTVAGADPAATGRLHDALDAWAATLEPGRPTVTADASALTVTACDPGSSAQRGPDHDRVDQVLDLPVTRSQAMAEYLDLGYDATESRCIGQRYASTFTGADTTYDDPDVYDATMDGIVRSCTGEPPAELSLEA